MLVAIYVRVSTEEQSKGYSVEVQKEECMAYCISKGFRWRIYEDIESGVEPARRGFQELRKAVEEGQVSGVVVWRLDRLSRDFLQAMDFLSHLKRHACFLHSVKEGQIGLDGGVEDFIRLITYFGFPAMEWHAIRERIRAGMRKRIEQGKYTGTGSIGYRKDGTIIEEEAGIVRKIFQLCVDGYGYNKIAKILNKEEALGREWSKRTVSQILKRPYYAGIIIPQFNRLSAKELLKKLSSGEYFPLKDIPPIIDLETYRQALERIANSDTERGRAKIAHEFSGLLRCGNCGSGLQLASSKGYYFLRCTKWSDGRCDNKVNFREFKKVFMEFLPELIREFREDVLEVYRQERESLLTEHRQKVRELQLRKERLREVIERYLEEFEKGTLTGEVVAERIRKKQEELKQIEEELVLMSLSEPETPSPEEVLDALELLDSQWEELSMEERNALLKEIFERIEVKRYSATLYLFDHREIHLTIPKDKRKPIDTSGLEGEVQKVALLWNSGMNMKDIAKTLGMSLSRVRYALKKARLGLKFWKKPYTFSRKAHLYEEEVLRLHSQGLSISAIARSLGISRSTVDNILFSHNLETHSE